MIEAGFEAAFWDAVLQHCDAARDAGLFFHCTGLVRGGPIATALEAICAAQNRRYGLVFAEERALLVVLGLRCDDAVADRAAVVGRDVAEQVREALRLFRTAGPSSQALIGVVRTVAWLVEHGAKEDRKALVEEAVLAAERCQPRAGACDYWHAVALGLSAREQPLNALGLLPKIIALLKQAHAVEPTLDESGPARVLALLLVRAPGWPTGPGNPDDAVLEAQKAVERSPKHPLNELALAEALAATGDPAGAKAACERASALASARADADGADWVAQAQALFEKL